MLVFLARTIKMDSESIELAHLTKEQEGRKLIFFFWPLASFWFDTFVVLFSTTRTLKDEWYLDIYIYRLTGQQYSMIITVAYTLQKQL